MSYQAWNALMWIFLALAIILAIAAAVFFKVARVRQARAALQGKGVEEEVQRLREQRSGTLSGSRGIGTQSRHPGAKYSHADGDVAASADSVDIRFVTGEADQQTDSGLSAEPYGPTTVNKGTFRKMTGAGASNTAAAPDSIDESATGLRVTPARAAAPENIDESATELRVAPARAAAPESIDESATGLRQDTPTPEQTDDDEGETVLWRNLPHDSDITDVDEALTRLMKQTKDQP